MKKKEECRYAVDPFNRLIAKESGRETQVAGFRHILDGEFKTDKNNSLFYHLKSPAQSSLPQQLKLKGSWSLGEDHNLIFTLDKESYTQSDKLTLQGEIIRAESSRIIFSLVTRDEQGRARFYLISLSGRWQADKYNRLSFLVSRKGLPEDEIVFTGTWEVNTQNQIIYSYTHPASGRNKKTRRTLTFKGYWDISRKFRLSYILNKETASGFDFAVSLGRPLKRGMRYEAGIGIAPGKEKITIYGSWKINEKLGVIFEMPREKGRMERILFGAECKLNPDYTLELKLKSALGKELGTSLRLSRDLLKGRGEAFIQALKDGKKTALIAGAGIRW